MNKTVFGILTILMNAIGVPAFMTGNVKGGIIAIVLYFVTCGIVGIINFIKGVLGGIKILKMTEEEFEAADKATLVDCIGAGKKA